MADVLKKHCPLSAHMGAGRFFTGAVRAFSYCPFYFAFLFTGGVNRKRKPEATPV